MIVGGQGILSPKKGPKPVSRDFWEACQRARQQSFTSVNSVSSIPSANIIEVSVLKIVKASLLQQGIGP